MTIVDVDDSSQSGVGEDGHPADFAAARRCLRFLVIIIIIIVIISITIGVFDWGTCAYAYSLTLWWSIIPYCTL